MVNKGLRIGILLKTRTEAFESFVISTAQHRSMLDQVLQVFGIQPDVDLDLMQPNQTGE